MKEWDTFLNQIEQKLGKDIVDKWMRCLKIIDFDACNLYLEAENSFHIAWFEEHIRKIAEKIFRNNNHHLIKIHFKKKQPFSSKTNTKQFLQTSIPIYSDTLNPHFTFEDFITDDQTVIIKKIFQNIKIGQFNPIFLYGPNGIGKTHLFTATASELKKQNLSVFYVHAETFTQHVVQAIRNSRMETFRSIYRNQDVLFIDDIQYLARRAATQEELFHTFNTLFTSQKQIFLSSVASPNRLQEIEPRLVSRFEWGIVLELQSLSSAKIGEILQKKAAQYSFPILEETQAFLLERFPLITTLMKALDVLVLRHKSNSPLDPSEAKKLLYDLLNEEKKRALTPEKIVQTTAMHLDISIVDIMGKSQTYKCALGRKISMYLCRSLLYQSFGAIGKYFQRDHSTVIFGCKFIENNKEEKNLIFALEEIQKKLNSISEK